MPETGANGATFALPRQRPLEYHFAMRVPVSRAHACNLTKFSI